MFNYIHNKLLYMITPSELRQNLYNLLDQVIFTGKPIEIERIKQKPDIIIDALIEEIGLTFSKNNFDRIINKAIHLEFTRDPFDRISVADERFI